MTEEQMECGMCGESISISATVCPECGVILFGDDAGQFSRQQTSKNKGRKTNWTDTDPVNTNSTHNGSFVQDKKTDRPITVSIVNFDMPFWSIVKLLIKISIAAIPAMFIIAMISLVLWAIFGGILVALIR